MTFAPKFAITRDDNDNLAYGTPYVNSAYQYQARLLANTEVTFTVPQNVNTVIISSTAPSLWTGLGSTPITVPSGAFTATHAVLNHAVKEVSPGATMRFISDVNVDVGLVFFNRDT